MLATISAPTTNTTTTGLVRAEQVDADLADVLYGERGHELITFFYRRTRNADSAAELLAETFATAALRRRSDPSLSPNQPEWLRNIAKLELSRYFRNLQVELTSVARIGMMVPRLTTTEILVLEGEVEDGRSQRLGARDRVRQPS